jgi:hypothetical protein
MELHDNPYQPRLENDQLNSSSSTAASAETKPMFNIFGAKPVIDPATGDFKNRFPAKRVLVSCIRSLTAGLVSAGSTIGNIVWSAYRATIGQYRIDKSLLTETYGQEPTEAYMNDFGKGASLRSTASMKKAFADQPLSPSKLIKMISPEVTSIEEMGYNASEDLGLNDGLIAKGGAVIIYGEEERAVMTHQMENVFDGSSDKAKRTLAEEAASSNDSALSEKLKSFTDVQALAYEKANSIRWDRRTFTANGNKIDCSTNPETHTTEQNLKNFKSAIKELTGEEPSDRQTYELMSLIDEENYTRGFPSGEDIDIGMAFKMSAMKDDQGKEQRDAMDIKYHPASKTFSIHYTSPPSYLSAINIPAPKKYAPKSLNLGFVGEGLDPKSLRAANSEERKAILGDVPQFTTSTNYTYVYTPHPQGEKGTVSIADSRQGYWPLE